MKRNRPKIYNRLTEDLLRRIKNGTYTGKIPGIDSLADEFKVNRKTVNKSISKLISSGHLARVHGKGTFIAGAAAAGDESSSKEKIRRRNSRRYALLVMVEDYYLGYMDLMAGLEEEISKIDGCLLYIKFDQKYPEKLLGNLRYNRIEGVIVCGLIGDRLLEMLKKEFSVLLVDYSSPKVPVNSIVWESYEAGLKLGEKLVVAGIREFYLLNTMALVDGRYVERPMQYLKRIAGVANVLEKNGVKIFKYDTDWGFSNLGRKHELALKLRKGPLKKALYCDTPVPVLTRLGCVDLVTSLVISGAGDRRSVDNSLPGIYITHDMLEMGREAGKCIIDIIGRPSTREKVITLIPAVVEVSSD